MSRHRIIGIIGLICMVPGGCDNAPVNAPQTAPAQGNAVPTTTALATQPIDAEREAARVLMWHAMTSKMYRQPGEMPPASWPEPRKIRRLDAHTWVLDVDASGMPGGYPEQFIVEVSTTGGHTGRPKR